MLYVQTAPEQSHHLREATPLFGRTQDEWEAIIEESIEILRAQARLKRVTSYSDLNSNLGRRGHRPFDFEQQSERAAMGSALGQVSRRSVGECGVMLSAIVVYIDRNDAGPGFYNLAVELGLLPNTASGDEKLAFWSGQVAKVHEMYARLPRRRRGAADD